MWKRINLLLGIFALYGVQAATLQEVALYPLSENRSKVIFFQSFDQNAAEALKLPGGYRLEKNTGCSNTAALFCSRSNPADYGIFYMDLPTLNNRLTYSAKVMARGENIKSVKAGSDLGILGVEFFLNGKWHSGGGYAKIQKLGSEWTEVTVSDIHVPMAPEIKTRLILYLARGVTGKIWFDDVEVQSTGESQALILARPDRLIFDAATDSIVFRSEQPVANRLLFLKIKNGEKTQELLLGGTDHSFRTTLSGLVPGEVSIEASIVNPEQKIRLITELFHLRKANTLNTGSGSVIDEHGRTIVDGAPFLPVGVFAGSKHWKTSEDDFRKISESGFNSLVHYDSFHLNNGNDDIQGGLDLIHKYGLKMIFSVKDQYKGNSNAITRYKNVLGEAAVVAAVAKEISTHPALLAWYISDEDPRSEVPAHMAMRELLSQSDPRHPTWTLTFRASDMPYYGMGGDIIGVDSYPLDKISDTSIKQVAEYMSAANTTGLPCWVVPQINNLNVYRTNDPEVYRNSRFPSAAEMRAMPLLAAIHGAKGFIFYSYFDIMHKGRILAPETADREWGKVVPVAKMLRALSPFLLSLQPAPHVEISGSASGDVEARAFVDGNGAIRVIIVGTGKPVDAVIFVPGYDNLISEYGITRPLGNGRYQFTASAADADILR